MNRNVLFISTIILLVSCSSSSNELTRNEQYDLINNYFIKDIIKENSQVLFYEYQLYDDFSSIDLNYEIEEIFEIEEVVNPPKSRFTNLKRDNKRLNKVEIVGGTFFESVNDSAALSEAMINRYQSNLLHIVSTPFYDSENKIAIIFDEVDFVGQENCIINTESYMYLKKGKEWISLKEFGTKNIYLTLSNYYESNSNN